MNTIPMPCESDLFAHIQLPPGDYGNMIDFDDPNDDLWDPTPFGRESSNGSPSSSLGTAPTPVAPTSTSNVPASNGGSSGEDPSKSFPVVLHTIVSDESSNNAIHWLPCGTRFVIASKDEFSKFILPHYFGSRGGSSSGSTTKFTSFTRRLKRWNFSRVPSGRDMGAYFHENFRRGEAELARRIVYPVNKSPPVNGKAGGTTSGGKARRRPSVTSRTTVPKAHRRASTGSMAIKFDAAALKFDAAAAAAALDSISPTPIKRTMKPSEVGSMPSMPVLENDMTNWLSSAGFVAEDGLLLGSAGSHMMNHNRNDTPSIDAEPVSVVSNSSGCMLPPPHFPILPMNVTLAGSQHGSQGSSGCQQTMTMRSPGMMRRHSVTIGSLTAPPPFLTGSSNGIQNSSSFTNPPSLLGMNFSCTPAPEVPMSSNTMNFLNYMPRSVNRQQSAPLVPKPEHTSSSGVGVGEKDPFGFSRDFSFEDLNMVDPFT